MNQRAEQSRAQRGPWHGGRLSARPNPLGWKQSEPAVRVDPVPPGSRALRAMRSPRRVPSGAAKLLRYGRTLWTLLRRPRVVRNPPVHLQMESTDACNLHCVTCTRDLLVQRASLLEETFWRKAIDEACPTNVNVSGIGEPFLHPRIFDLIRYAKQCGAAVN